MALILPVKGIPSDILEISLSDEVYSISLRWVDRTESWYLAIAISGSDTLINYEKVTPFQNIVNYNAQLLPDGRLYVMPESSNPSEELNRSNFGSLGIYKLVYYTNEELVDILAKPTFEGWFLV